EQDVDGIHGAHRIEDAAQDVHQRARSARRSDRGHAPRAACNDSKLRAARAGLSRRNESDYEEFPIRPESTMHGLLRALVAVQLLASPWAIAADEKVLVELNTAEPSDNHCRVSFVIENKSAGAIQSMK